MIGATLCLLFVLVVDCFLFGVVFCWVVAFVVVSCVLLEVCLLLVCWWCVLFVVGCFGGCLSVVFVFFLCVVVIVGCLRSVDCCVC